MTPKTLTVTDNFSVNNFHDARDVYFGLWSWTPMAPPVQQPQYQSAIEPGALTVAPAGLTWWDGRHSPQDGFTSAKVWAEIATAADQEDMQVLVGWQGQPLLVSLKEEGEVPKAGASPNPQSNAPGFSGGPVTPFNATTPQLALDVFGTAHSSFHGNMGPGNIARAPIAPGRVELVFTPDGNIVVTGPDGTQLTYATDPESVAEYLADPLYPFVSTLPGVGSTPIVLSAWGYEIDYPVPPPVPGTVIAGQGRTGALRH